MIADFHFEVPYSFQKFVWRNSCIQEAANAPRVSALDRVGRVLALKHPICERPLLYACLYLGWVWFSLQHKVVAFAASNTARKIPQAQSWPQMSERLFEQFVRTFGCGFLPR